MLHPAVKQAVVVVRDEPAAGKRLVAYLVAEADLRAATQEMRGFLKSVLPDYNPGGLCLADQLPLRARWIGARSPRPFRRPPQPIPAAPGSRTN
jgi:acyl-coenzyme A synthetase/AMP-(fatty) acid ligase